MNKFNQKNIGIIDSDLIRRRLLKSHLELVTDYKITFDVSSAKGIEDRIDLNKVNVILMEAVFGYGSSFACCSRIKKQFPDIKIVAFSRENDRDAKIKMFDAQVSGIINIQDDDLSSLLETINGVAAKGFHFNEDIVPLLNRVRTQTQMQMKLPAKSERLFTKSEVEIAILSVSNLTSEQIGKKMKMSKRTVDSVKNNLKERTMSKSMTGVVYYLVRFGYCEWSEMDLYEDELGFM